MGENYGDGDDRRWRRRWVLFDAAPTVRVGA